MLSRAVAPAITFDKFIRKRLKTVKLQWQQPRPAYPAATGDVARVSVPSPRRRLVGHCCSYWPLTIFGDLMRSSDWSWPAFRLCRPPWSWPLFDLEAMLLSGEAELLGAMDRCCCCERIPEGLTSPLIRSPPRPRNPPPPSENVSRYLHY